MVMIRVGYIQDIDQISKYVHDNGSQYPLVLEKEPTHTEREKTGMKTMALIRIGSTSVNL